ncbi:CPBP family glutamic-type intramembrane protease [Nesterenkonia ebinurensis]|uniref:CPBP family glutamic-type intramembrane protease n=1 Tax=Nesterenkonia ebinurensis TaxID=2608252 RepID=UPI00168B0C10|nr:CPBP family glutamic-type intramembrane protease [Nesterenkonia ebinurensis]
MLVLIIWFASMVALAPAAEIAQQALGLSFELFALVTVVPTVAAAFLLFRPQWLPRPWPGTGAGSLVVSVVASLAGVIAFALTAALLFGRVPTLPNTMAGLPVVLFIAIQGIGVLTEEIGWRGVAQRCGETFIRPWVFSALAGFVFGVTHLGYWSLGVQTVITFSVATMLMSLSITSVFCGFFWQRMVPATITHLGFNITLNSLEGAGNPVGVSPLIPVAAISMLGVAIGTNALLLQFLRNRQR